VTLALSGQSLSTENIYITNTQKPVMPQEENELSWFESFKQGMNPVFTEKDFKRYDAGVKNELQIFKKYLKKDARILDTGCGLGCEAVPLSKYGYDVVGIDNDKKVVEAARKNGKTFGGKIDIVYGNIFEIDKIFGKDSFDACTSGGVLEHFPRNQIRDIIDKSLYIAPLVIASMPISLKEDVKSEYKDFARRICKDGIYRNLWTADHWIKNIFKGYNIIESIVTKASPAIGGFDEIFVIIGRKK
jgi:SAM-dependent methyltransferase